MHKRWVSKCALKFMYICTVPKSGRRKKGKRPCPIKNHNIKNTHLFNILSSGLFFKDQRGEEIKIPNQKIVSLFAICIQIQIQSNKFIKAHCLQQRIQKFFTVNPQYKEYSALYTVCVLFMTK